MDDWVPIISKQWYITPSTYETAWFCFELNELREVNYVILHYRSLVQRIYIFLNKAGSRARKYHQYNRKCHRYCITMFIPLYIIISPVIDKARLRVSSTRRFLFYTAVLLYLRLNPYISYLYNPDQNSSLASQTICDHMFSDPRSDCTFHVIGYVLGFFSLM